MELLDKELAFGITVLHAVGGLVGIALLVWVSKFFRSEKVDNKIVRKHCKSCGWKGPAGKTNRQCPQCRGPLYSGG
jgi:hypothetical protein